MFNTFKISRAYVKQIEFACAPNGEICIELEVVVIDKEKNKMLNVPLKMKDPNWEYGPLSKRMQYKKDSRFIREKEKYTVLKWIQNENKQNIFTTEEQNEEIKNKIFELIEGEIVLFRSITEQEMFQVFN